MARNYYAVKRGITPGIFFTWEDCEKNIRGYPHAAYKKVASLKEAEDYVCGTGDVDGEISCPAVPGTEAEPGGERLSHGAVAYVDGSYNKETKEYSCGVVLFWEGKTEHISRKFSDPEMASMRNVAGEIEGSMCAIRYCLERGIESLAIYYDYEGIEKWCTGAWKANKKGTIAYRDFCHRAREKMEIRFVKVKGHSGDEYNDMADQLAKQALGLE